MFSQLTPEQKDVLLKSLAFFAVQSNGQVEMLEDFAKYVAQGFDLMVETEIKGKTIVFKKKENK